MRPWENPLAAAESHNTLRATSAVSARAWDATKSARFTPLGVWRSGEDAPFPWQAGRLRV